MISELEKKERGWYYVGKHKHYWKACDFCKNEYRGIGKSFCSYRCMRLACPIILSGEKSPMNRPDVIEKIRLKKIGQSLSKEHRLKISLGLKGKKRPNFSGSNHPNWKGNLINEQRRLRSSGEYKRWRSSIYERDDYTCQHCGKKGGRLNADHIKRFAEYPKLRFDLTNGQTLCVSCHLKTDNYGTRGMKFTKTTKTEPK